MIWAATQMFVYPLTFLAWHLGWLIFALRWAPGLTAGAAGVCLLTSFVGCVLHSAMLTHFPTDGFEIIDVARFSVASAVVAWPLAHLVSAATSGLDGEDRVLCLFLGLFWSATCMGLAAWFTRSDTFAWAVIGLVALPFLLRLGSITRRRIEPAPPSSTGANHAP